MKSILFSIAALLTGSLVSQNLVPNPSFEDTVNCPEYNSEANKALHWDNCGWGGTADYFNSCSPAINGVGVPNNFGGYQQAATGNAYGGLYAFGGPGANYREYLTAKLTSPLVKGKTYYVKFLVNKAEEHNTWSCTSVNKIGARFRTTACPTYSDAVGNFYYPDNKAHVYTSTIMSDEINWRPVCGSFVADSAYKYIVLGNFFDSTQTNALLPSSPCYGGYYYAYYYIDDVVVTETSQDCSQTGLDEMDLDHMVMIWPNPTTERLNLTNTTTKSIDFLVLKTIQGEEILRLRNIVTRNFSIDMYSMKDGVYILELGIDHKRYHKRIIKN